ncbi:MAG: S8 family peptidase [Rhodobacteraceae bacterium]|nr:S8 family peptidase [Paracoccaceae bacterium]
MGARNYLLGKGERLTEDIVRNLGGGPKYHPYTIDEAHRRLTKMANKAVNKIDQLPKEACPKDKAVISITLHPEYIAKSYFPNKLLQNIGVDVVGSRPRKIKPQKRSRNRETIEMVTTELFTFGARSAVRAWSQKLQTLQKDDQSNNLLLPIEEISAPTPKDKIRGELPPSGDLTLETILHASEMDSEIIQAFINYLEKQEISIKYGRRFFAKGLCFQALNAPVNRVEDIAAFTGVRLVRQMPGLRIFRPFTLSSRSSSQKNLELPDESPISKNVKVAIFDGGIPEKHPLTKWVNPLEPPGMIPTKDEFLSHGIAVSSAALFGHIDTKKPIQRPYSYIDHYRVVDDAPGQDNNELYEVLDRIENILLSNDFDFINLSIGPRLPIEDDDVHAWTAVLDEYLSKNSTLAMIAVGNDGEGDTIQGFDRIQVPSDCVNAMAIGACNKPDENWKRTSYSSKGPGRSPGIVKPDLVDFGGEITRPFLVVSPNIKPTLDQVQGTSFATPSVLRLGIGVRAHFGMSLNHLAIRTLLIHTCENNEQPFTEVGWGRAARTLNDLVLCNHDTIRIVYQGEISPAKFIRATIPVPDQPFQGFVSITSTICYKTPTDPHHPSNYTRAGLEVTFRPHDDKFNRNKQIHPNADAFFGSKVLGATEKELRRYAWKWENCLHATRRKKGTSLQNPCFDIHYNSRLESQNFTPDHKLNYAMVVTVQAKGAPDLYNQVVRKYATVIEPLLPIWEIPTQTIGSL